MLKILCCVKQVPDVDQMRMDPHPRRSPRHTQPSGRKRPVGSNESEGDLWRRDNAHHHGTAQCRGRAARVPCGRRGQGGARYRPRVRQCRHLSHELLHPLCRKHSGQLRHDLLRQGIARRRHRSDGRTACPALRRFSGDGHAAHRKL